MILTVTINPLLERRYLYPAVKFNSNNRGGEYQIAAGGKGINVSRQLKYLSTESFIFTFTGGSNGKIFADVLRNEGLKFTTQKIKNETRDAAVIFDLSAGQSTYCFGVNADITSSESDEFKDKLDKMIKNCEIVVFSGSSPCETADDIFPFGIKKANEYDKISVCDTYGKHLGECIKAVPTIIHNNIDEVEKSLTVNLQTDESKSAFLDELYSAGIKQAYLTNGSKVSYASNFDYHYSLESLNINPVDSTGSGDAFTAGVVYGWFNDFTFEQNLRLAGALGALNASSREVCAVNRNDAFEAAEKIKFNTIGKKIKTI